MNRRTFLLLTCGTLSCPSSVVAQIGRTYRVGLGFQVAEAVAKPLEEAFLAGLRDHGYVEGRNIIVDVRYANGDAGRLHALADELIALKPDVLAGFESMAQAMKAKTATIPIVLTNSSNPIASGLAQSLGRPGGNVTGISSQWEDLVPKHIELFREILPKLSRLGLLVDTTQAGTKAGETNARDAARRIGVTIVPYYIKSRADVEQAFAVMDKDRLDGFVFASGTALTLQLVPLISEKASRLRLPFSFFGGELATFTFGPSLTQAYRDSARYVDRILKGAKPGDLPIEQPTRFEMVVNLKAARALGLKVPYSVMLRADRVIE